MNTFNKVKTIKDKFWDDLKSFIIYANPRNTCILEENTATTDRVTILPDVRNGIKGYSLRGKCSITILTNMIGTQNDNYKRRVFMKVNPNMVSGTLTHSTIILLSRNPHNLFHKTRLDNHFSVRVFFIRIMFFDSFLDAKDPILLFKSYELRSEIYYLYPYSVTQPFIPISEIGTQLFHEISPASRRFRPFYSNTKVSIVTNRLNTIDEAVKECTSHFRRRSYACPSNARKIDTLVKIFNITGSLTSNFAASSHGYIELGTVFKRYLPYQLSRMEYELEKG